MKNLANFAIIFLLIVNLGLMGFLLNKAYFNEFKCQVNPLVYGVSEISKVNAYDLTCRCSFATPGITSTLYVDKYSLKIQQPTSLRTTENSLGINWSSVVEIVGNRS